MSKYKQTQIQNILTL